MLYVVSLHPRPLAAELAARLVDIDDQRLPRTIDALVDAGLVTVSDDGLPDPPGAVTVQWSVDAGAPGTVVFADLDPDRSVGAHDVARAVGHVLHDALRSGVVQGGAFDSGTHGREVVAKERFKARTVRGVSHVHGVA